MMITESCCPDTDLRRSQSTLIDLHPIVACAHSLAIPVCVRRCAARRNQAQSSWAPACWDAFGLGREPDHVD